MSTNIVNYGKNKLKYNCGGNDNINYKKYSKCSDNMQLTRMNDDVCNIDCRSYTSQKPIKYYTTNFHNKGCNPQSLCYPGFTPQDGYGFPQCSIDKDSELRHSKITNVGYPQQLKCTPVPTVPYMGRGCLNADAESELRGVDTNGSKPCLPKDSAHHNRHFEDFSTLCFKPNAVKNTVWPGNQTGMDTRQQRIEPYRNCNYGANNVNQRNPSTYKLINGNKTDFNVNRNGMGKRYNYNPNEYQGNYGVSGYIENKKPLQGNGPSCPNLNL